MLKTMSKVTTGLMNAVCIFGIAFATIGPFPANADTTGEAPTYMVLEDGNQYLMDSSIENYSMQDVLCLIENMYFEARSDGYAGMYATTMVVMNRVDDHRYPDNVCDVVRQGPVRESWKTRQHPDLIEADRIYYPIKNKCQFSWYCDGKADEMKDEDSFYLARDIARLVLDMSSGVLGEQQMIDITEGSTHYHTTYVSPNWRNDRGMMKITLVGSHIFYRWN